MTGLVPVSSTGQALWVRGAILAGSACQNAVASALSPWRNWNNLRQYLREWLYDDSDRTSPCQTDLDVSLCFAPLLRWVLTWWRSGRLALAVDPTLKGDQTTAIVISVVYRSCAIPVAWRIHRATQRGSWMGPTVELLKELAPAVPRDMTVIVLCDRGISSPKLWKQIRAQSLPPTRSGAGIPICATGRTSPSAPTAANDCLPAPSSPFLTLPGSAVAPPSAHLPPSAVAPCWWSGTPSRKNPGSSSPTLRPIGWDPAGTPCASRSNWVSRPSRAWAGSRKDSPHRSGPHLPPLAGCRRWPPCWPWPTAPEPAPYLIGGWGTPRTGGLLQATCGHRPKRWLPITVPPVAVRRAPSA